MVKCELCGKLFKQITWTHLLSQHNITIKRYGTMFPDAQLWSSDSKKRMEGNTNSSGHLPSDEEKRRISLTKQTQFNSPIGDVIRRHMSVAHIGHIVEEITKERISLSMSGNKNPFYGRLHTRETKSAISIAMKLAHSRQGASYNLGAIRGKMNRCESKVSYLLRNICPGEFRYNGDGRVAVLDGLKPDFVNVNGKKTYIEYNGRNWHKDGKEGEDKRQKRLLEIGWRGLFIWEEELVDMGTLKNKILSFTGGV